MAIELVIDFDIVVELNVYQRNVQLCPKLASSNTQSETLLTAYLAIKTRMTRVLLDQPKLKIFDEQ